MKYIYQTVTVDINDEITSVGDFYASKELCIKAIERHAQNANAEDWKGHPWHNCRLDIGSCMTVYQTVELKKVIISSVGVTTRYGFIIHKMYEM